MNTILFAWRRLPPPAFIGGAEITEGLWAGIFASLGFRVLFIGSAENPRDPKVNSMDWLHRMLKHENVEYSIDGSRIEYVWRGVRCICLPQTEVISAAKATLSDGVDMIWTSQEGCDEIAALANNRPVVSYMHSVTNVGMLSAAINARFLLVPSRFVLRTVSRQVGSMSTLARPIIEGARRLLPQRAEDRDIVLFVNPIPEKGLDVAESLARSLPQWDFVFVEGWRSFEPANRRIPTNIRVLPRQPSLKWLYDRSRLLIVPSTIADAAPRVVSEAGRNGIPVLGSFAGGIPELVADPRRNCISVSRPIQWTKRARHLLEDEQAWMQASVAQGNLTHKLLQNPISVLAESGILEAIA